MRIDRIEANATPSDRSGTLVNFGIKAVRAAQVILKDAQGRFIPEGSAVQLNTREGASRPMGFDGVVYFDALEQHNQIWVTTDAGVCSAQFEYPVQVEGIPQIGPLTCR